MSSFLYKMEKKFGKYAIPNLPLVLIICYAFGYVMNIAKPDWMYVVNLNPYAILHGQVWRLFTWVLVPESTSIWLVIIVLYFYYSIGRILEKTWGSFLFNVYIFSGMLFTILGAFGLFGFFEIFAKDTVAANEAYCVASNFANACPAWMGGSYTYASIAQSFGTYYINMSIFLAFAIMYPNMEVYVLFVLPVKVKYLGVLYVILLGMDIVLAFLLSGASNGMISFVSIGMSLLNTLVFFILTKKGKYKSPKEIKRQKDYKVKIKKAVPVSNHKCAICGQTSDSNPNLTFRYCSKCKGSYEYCSEHIFTHTHIQ